MNAEDKWIKLWENIPFGHEELVVCDYDYEKWANKLESIGKEMIETIEALRELNHNQFQEIGRLQNLVRQYGGKTE